MGGRVRPLPVSHLTALGPRYRKNTETLKQLAKVCPHLEFSSPWLIGDRKAQEKVHEKAVKMVTGLKGTTYEERSVELGLESKLRIRIHLIRIPIQHFRLNTDPDPDPIRIQGFDDQKLKKFYS